MSTRSSFAAADSPELRGFFEAIIAAGSDLSPRLILADWLDERGWPQEAERLRLHVALVATCCQPENHPERVQQQARLVELLASGVRPCVPRRTVALTESVDMTFAWIPPGTFLMGSPPGEKGRRGDEMQHRVTLTRGFYLGIHLVTQAQWQTVMGYNPSYHKGDNLPVEQVSWADCQEFCQKWSQRDGKHYRLPTEAEWEYACRAGTNTAYFFGDDPKDLGQHAWFFDNSDHKTHNVGATQPNAWGLYDMHGNVWEWCQDWYGPYPKENMKDPHDDNGEARVLRGGSWISHAEYCRAAYRGWHAPAARHNIFGLRGCFRLD